MSSPISFLVQHENTILTAYNENNGKPRNTWSRLEKDLPELAQAMTFNTFKQYVSVFAFVKSRLDEVRQREVTQKTGNLKSEKEELKQELRIAMKRLDKVKQNRAEILKQLEETLKKKTRLEAELNKRNIELNDVRQIKQSKSQVKQKSDDRPKRIAGWSVQHSKDGYYRCYRKISKRVYSVYLGKVLDVKEAENRISAKEKSLGIM